MILQPSNKAQLTQFLAAASAKKEKVERIDLSALNRVVEHTPEDMTVTVEAGVTLSSLQAHVGRHRQWLAIDPPHPERATIGDIINANLSGPRRYGCGTIRDYLIGLTAVLAHGTVIHSGGKVVKNVAGYDLMKLFIGGQGTLGVVTEATFKLRPLPELEKFASVRCQSLEAAEKLIELVINSEVTPNVLDLDGASNLPVTVILGFAGTREEVEWQLARSAEIGFTESAALDHETRFWSDLAPARRLSVLPSKMIEAIRGLGDEPFIARAGNGIVYHRGASGPRANKLPLDLMRRLKGAYDPNHIFPALPPL